MPTLDVTGAYVGVEAVKTATKIATTEYDALILEHLLAASRAVEGPPINRRFFPVVATNKYRWPSLNLQASWELWTEDDLLSVSSISVAAAGQNAVPVAITNYFLEPQWAGPPYNRVEIDLSSSDAFQAGPTPQQSVQITGVWGYSADTQAAGTLGGSINASVTSLVVSSAALVDQGDVLLIDSEAIYVDTGRSAPTSTTLTVKRGVNGTTAASHTSGAAIARYRAPDDVRRLVRADAIASFTQDLAAWGRNVGSGETAAEFQGKALEGLRKSVCQNYRRTRLAAV